MEFLGYKVETQMDEKRNRNMYLLHGKRGACYGLVRTVNDPCIMFAINMSRASAGNTVSLKGNYWFTDRNGKLETVN